MERAMGDHESYFSKFVKAVDAGDPALSLDLRIKNAIDEVWGPDYQGNAAKLTECYQWEKAGRPKP